MRVIHLAAATVLAASAWQNSAWAWATANRYGGSTSHSYGETSHANAYGGSRSHAYGEGTEHTNRYGGSTSGAYGAGATHTYASGATAYHPPGYGGYAGYPAYHPPVAVRMNTIVAALGSRPATARTASTTALCSRRDVAAGTVVPRCADPASDRSRRSGIRLHPVSAGGSYAASSAQRSATRSACSQG